MSYVVESAHGTISVPPSVLADLVVRAAETVEGAQVRRGRRRLEIELANGGARIRLELAARHGSVLPDLARAVQERVAAAIEETCGVAVEAIDVSVEEVV
jgi:uncharacterized alkaline shock family protein YloU